MDEICRLALIDVQLLKVIVSGRLQNTSQQTCKYFIPFAKKKQEIRFTIIRL